VRCSQFVTVGGLMWKHFWYKFSQSSVGILYRKFDSGLTFENLYLSLSIEAKLLYMCKYVCTCVCVCVCACVCVFARVCV